MAKIRFCVPQEQLKKVYEAADRKFDSALARASDDEVEKQNGPNADVSVNVRGDQWSSRGYAKAEIYTSIISIVLMLSDKKYVITVAQRQQQYALRIGHEVLRDMDVVACQPGSQKEEAVSALPAALRQLMERAFEISGAQVYLETIR